MVLEGELLPVVFVPEVVSVGLRDGFALPPLLGDPPLLVPLSLETFEVAAVVNPAGDVCQVLVAFVALGSVEDVALLACWIAAWMPSRVSLADRSPSSGWFGSSWLCADSA